MAGFPWLKCSSVVFALLGAAILIIGVVITPREFPGFFNGKLDEYLVVNSAGSQGYSTWSGGADVNNAYYLVYNMYNLTNLADVLVGKIPIYDVVGPYMYRRYRTSVNVSFPDNGNQIQYSNFYNYIFDSNASGPGLSSTDLFLNINPVYIGGLMQASGPNAADLSGEVAMLMGATGGLFGQILDVLTGPFVPVYLNYEFPSYFMTIMDEIIIALNETQHDTQLAYTQFIDTWRNATTAADLAGNWTGMLLNQHGPAGISSESAQNLLDPSVEFSLLDPSPEAAWAWTQANIDLEVAMNLTQLFKIELNQVYLIWNWRASVFAPQIMYPKIIALYGLDDISDIGWVQFVTTEPLQTESFTIWPGLGFQGQLELAAAGVNVTGTTWQEWRTIMDPNTGLTNITNFLAFMQTYAVIGPGGNYERWGLDDQTSGGIAQYALTMIYSFYVPTLTAVYGSTGGLFVTRTVDEWAYHCDDYLLNMLQEVPPMCSFKYNFSADPINTIFSGQNDITKINQYGVYEDQSTIYGWQTPIAPVGYTELGQFAPKYALPSTPSNPPLPVFQADLMRTIYLNYTTTVTVQGISANRYVLDFNRTFYPDPLYFQAEYGMANASSFHGGSPIFLSLWDMLYVNNATGMVGGMNQTDELDSTSVLDIEPVTGTTIQARKRLQVNVYVPYNNPATGWWYFGGSGSPMSSLFGNQDFTTGIYYPIAKIGEYATISSGQASELQSKLQLEGQVVSIAFYAGVSAGPALIILGAVLLVFAIRRKRGQYTELHT